MNYVIILPSLILPFSLWSQDISTPILHSQKFYESLVKHYHEIYDGSNKLMDDLDFPIEDQRVLLHLPNRGFRYMALLLDARKLVTYAGSTLFMPDTKLPTCSREENAASELLARAMVNRVLANKYACFRLMRELAPTPKAIEMEARAKELKEKLDSNFESLSECEFLNQLESIRIFFDGLKDLPKMTPSEYARERLESAMLAPADYRDNLIKNATPGGNKWPYIQLDRHNLWESNGYLFAYSECLKPGDYDRFQMVVKPQGGIFYGTQLCPGDGCPIRDYYETKLPHADVHTLETYLTKMAPSDASAEDIRFIISFSENGKWVTRTYRSLPADNPFQPILKRMIYQNVAELSGLPENGFKSIEFLAPAK